MTSCTSATSLRVRLLALVAISAIFYVFPSGAAAVPGAVDPSYGVRGASVAADAPHFSFAADSKLQDDGKLLLTGARTSVRVGRQDDDSFSFDIRVHPVVTRTLPDGTPDASWGTGGAATVYVQDHLSVATNVDPLPGGGALVTGASIGLLSASTFVAKLDETGRLDPTFATDGVVKLLPADMNALVPIAVHRQADGKVLVVADSFSGDILALTDEGSRRRSADFDVVLVRFGADGRLDPTFGSGGILRWESVGTRSMDAALGASFGADGSVTVAGGTVNDTLTMARSLVARFSSNGVLDPSFGAGGIVRSPAKVGIYEAATAVEPGADGGISLGIVRFVDKTDQLITQLRKLSPAGANIRSTILPGDLLPSKILTLPDGRTYVGGLGSREGGADLAWGSQAAITRIAASGAVDTGFERGGVAFVGDPGERTIGSAVAGLHPGPAGTLLVGGTFNGRAGSVRLFGDSAAGAGGRVVIVKMRVAPGAVGCGTRAAHACRIAAGSKRAIKLRISAPGVPAGTKLQVVEDYDWMGWGSERVRPATVRAGGVAVVDISSVKFHNEDLDGFEEEDLHRFRVEVPATATSRSASATAYTIRVGAKRHPADGVVLPPRLVQKAADARPPRAEGLCIEGAGPLAANARLACAEFAKASRGTGDWRAKARRWLGR